MRAAVFAAALLVLAAVRAEITEEDDVMVLTDANFEEAIGANKHVLVEFYAPWCGHCKKLTPEYAAAAGKLKAQESAVKLAKVDATENKAIAAKFGVKGYPTLKFFVDGVAKEYTGGRVEKEIVSWLSKKTGDPCKAVTTMDQVTAEVAENKFVLVAAMSDRSSEAGAAYTAAASDAEGTVFLVTSDAALMTELALEDGNVMAVRSFEGEEPHIKMDVAVSAENLATFVASYSLPLVVEFSDEVAPKIFGGELKHHFLFFSHAEVEGHAAVMSEFRKVADTFKGKFIHVFIDTTKNARLLDFFKVTKEDGNQLRIIHLSDGVDKFVPEFTELTEENMAAFAQSYIDGNLKKHLNSEEVPEDWDAQGVKVLVGKNFEAVAFDESKDVLVEFYAPWCGHCKKLVPIYDELAEKYKEHPTIVIAKMDSTANEVADITVKGFPTLKFFPKGPKKVVDYNGGRTLEDFVAFLDGQHDESAEDAKAEAIEEQKDEL